MAEFAIGSISTLASRNPQLPVNGLVPYLGSHLTVYWQTAIPLCACIAAAHFALFALAVFVTRVVIIKDDSNLAIARLLRSVVDTLGDSGTLLTGEEISEAIRKSGKSEVIYGPSSVEGFQGFFLDLNQSINPRAELVGNRHPDGKYL